MTEPNTRSSDGTPERAAAHGARDAHARREGTVGAPSGAEAVGIDPRRQRRSRLVLVGLFSLFGFPLLLASFWFQQVQRSGESLGNTSHGELIVPAVPLDVFALEQGDAEFTVPDLRGLWTLLYVADGSCDTTCEQSLYHMRQVRLALNHRKDRVQRAAVVESESTLDAELLETHRGLLVLTGGEAARAALVDQIRAAERGLPPRADSVYLVDPLGNLMMRFPSGLDPRSMLDDLKHLLKVSRIG